MDQPKAPGNLFERNPQKIIFLVVLGFLIIVTYAAEKVLEFRMRPQVYRLGATRYVKLRELGPGYADVLEPTDLGLKLSDGLARKGYPVRVDDNGFIIPSKIHERPDLTIVFLGGSTTECLYMEEENRFPYVVGRLLEEKTGKKTNSYNGGKAGNNSLHAIDLLINKIIPLKPDVVVFMENINDLSVLLYQKTYWTVGNARSPIIDKPATLKTVGKNLEEDFHLLRDLLIPNLAREFRKISLRFRNLDEFQGSRGKQIQIDENYLVHEFSLNLQTLVSICQARNLTPVLMTQANRLTAQPDPFVRRVMQRLEQEQGISYADYKKIYDKFNAAIVAVGAKNHLTVIDLAGEVPPAKEFFVDLVHFNDHGSRYAAKIISERLAPLVGAN